MACPNCGKEFSWDTYYAGKILQCVGCDRRFLSAAPEEGQALLLPEDATPRGVITLDTLASMDSEFADMAELGRPEEGSGFELTVLGGRDAAEVCRFCGASVLPGVAVCGRCGLNPQTGQEVPGFPPAVWAVRKKQPKSRAAIFWQWTRIRFARMGRWMRRRQS
jgi:hypothetical protein